MFYFLIEHLKLYNKMRWVQRGNQDSINQDINIFELLYLSSRIAQ